MKTDRYKDRRIDAHAHLVCNLPRLALLAFMEKHRLRVHNICGGVEDGWRDPDTRLPMSRDLHRDYPDLFAWGTGFDMPRFGDAGYYDAVLSQMDEDFAAGATSVKIWRQIGMEERKPDGSFIMMDDPFFDPIYRHLIRCKKPLINHVAEPFGRWPSSFAVRERFRFFEWGPLGPNEADGCPDYPEQIAARDRVLEKYPDLIVVGAHLGSMEYDVDEVAKRLDRYPNFAVDLSGRTSDLACQDSGKVRDFFLKYQDRLLWGVDPVSGRKTAVPSWDAEKLRGFWEWIERTYVNEFRYYESGEEVEFYEPGTQSWRKVGRGLDLPASVLEKIYIQNALKWFPGLF